MSLFGRAWGTNISGRIRLDGKKVELSNVASAIDAGLAYVTEDRKQLGLILSDDVRRTSRGQSRQVASRLVIDDIKEMKAAGDYRNGCAFAVPTCFRRSTSSRAATSRSRTVEMA